MNILRKYRHDAEVRQSDFADEVGVSQATISKIERGEILPSLKLAAIIEKATRGAVTATSWIEEVTQ